MNYRITTATIAAAIALAGATSVSAHDHESGTETGRQACASIIPPLRAPALHAPTEATAEEAGCAVAQWQLAAAQDMTYLDVKYPESSYGRGWVKAAFYVGLDRFAAAMGDEYLLARVRQYSFDNGLELGDRPWHGDDQAVAAIYANVALRDGNPGMMEKTQEQFDHIIAQNHTNSLEFIEPTDGSTEGTCQLRWCWADAIFMAPPAWALTTQVTGDDRYLDYAASETRAIIEYLQDPESGLLFRDSRYFEARTEHGLPVFWSRGNGWVFAGLARFIEAMPEDHPERPLMVETFQTLAARLVTIQREDGYWPTSLLDPTLILEPETSGTAFFGFGLAWGLNNGFIEGDEYVQSRDRAWDAMRAATENSGMVGWVQQIGKDPQSTTAGTSQLYASGGMLLFASEMLDHD
ncbi:glycoside hydrolase family 88/105 protein [Aurantiacibacter marinus]|uniref:glycoside hydrolase family 88/105 protein n=1 Tax=Aurantiacibacter marinus TaxID=874156 RepID=UPI000AC8F673|nr:glycoside hydrolase family 88 protein [Aurantiacibacter marinus]